MSRWLAHGHEIPLLCKEGDGGGSGGRLALPLPTSPYKGEVGIFEPIQGSIGINASVVARFTVIARWDLRLTRATDRPRQLHRCR